MPTPADCAVPRPPTMPIAITREVSSSLADCQLSFVDRSPIDVARANEQHRAYQRLLSSLGCTVLSLDAEPELPDAVFVEDVAVVVDELAVMKRPGAPRPRRDAAWRRCWPATPVQARSPRTLDGGTCCASAVAVLANRRAAIPRHCPRARAAGTVRVTVAGWRLVAACTEIGGYRTLGRPRLLPRVIDREPFTTIASSSGPARARRHVLLIARPC